MAPTSAQMSIAHFTLVDVGGGAAGAVSRLHRELLQQGISSRMYVGRKLGTDPHTFDLSDTCLLREHALTFSRRLDLLPLLLHHGQPESFWSPGWHGMRSVMSEATSADVLSFYWIPRGLLGIAQVGRMLSLGKPCVWRLSDMWPFTGGCHYSGDCTSFQRGCGNCPQLRSRRARDLSSRLFASKREHWRTGNLTIVSPSRWMAEAAKRSPILANRNVRVIATGVDTDVFQPHDRNEARRALGLPLDRKLILFGADAALKDGRKGGSAVLDVMRRITTQGNTGLGLVLFGTDTVPEGLPDAVSLHLMGTITNQTRLANLYAACDVFLAPSKQENLANTVLEAMACGTPVVAYALGGMVEAIEHGQTGLLATPGDNATLGEMTITLLTDDAMRRHFSDTSRARACTFFDLRTQTAKYIALYRELTDYTAR